MCRGHQQHPELFEDIYRILDEKYHHRPSMVCVITDHFIAFRSTQTYSCFVLYLEILAIQHLFPFTLEYYQILYQECRENFTTSGEFLIQVILITITILFLVTVLFLIGKPTIEL